MSDDFDHEQDADADAAFMLFEGHQPSKLMPDPNDTEPGDRAEQRADAKDDRAENLRSDDEPADIAPMNPDLLANVPEYTDMHLGTGPATKPFPIRRIDSSRLAFEKWRDENRNADLFPWDVWQAGEECGRRRAKEGGGE